MTQYLKIISYLTSHDLTTDFSVSNIGNAGIKPWISGFFFIIIEQFHKLFTVIKILKNIKIDNSCCVEVLQLQLK